MLGCCLLEAKAQGPPAYKGFAIFWKAGAGSWVLDHEQPRLLVKWSKFGADFFYLNMYEAHSLGHLWSWESISMATASIHSV